MELFIPKSPIGFTPSAAADFLVNLDTELGSRMFDDVEREKLEAVMGRKLVDPATREAYLHRFSQLLDTAVGNLFASKPNPRVIELGCGSGTVSLLLSLLGAEVLALDMDPDLIEACRKRQALYERYAGTLRLRFECCNVVSRSFESDGRFDGIYSLFAFNIMQPTKTLISRLVPALAHGGTLVVSDGNRESIYNQLFRRRPILRPRELERELTGLGCATRSLSYDMAIPAAVWRRRGLRNRVQWLERRVTQSPFARWVSTSYTLVAERT